MCAGCESAPSCLVRRWVKAHCDGDGYGVCVVHDAGAAAALGAAAGLGVCGVWGEDGVACVLHAHRGICRLESHHVGPAGPTAFT